MGYADAIDEKGRRVGYAVSDVCNKHFCKTKIDRGMAYRCSRCDNFFCAEHLWYTDVARGQYCPDCLVAVEYEHDHAADQGSVDS